MIKHLTASRPVCVTVALLDGIVLARCGINHSMNYRSVVVFGKGKVVNEEKEKIELLRAFTDSVVPRRWDQCRTITKAEITGTAVVCLSINEASAKIRTGPPHDNKEDEKLPIWAGVIPVKQVACPPIPGK